MISRKARSTVTNKDKDRHKITLSYRVQRSSTQLYAT